MSFSLFLTTTLQIAALGTGAQATDAGKQGPEITSFDDSRTLPVIEVRSARQDVLFSVKNSLGVLSASEVELEAPKHPNEVFDRVQGAWVSAGSVSGNCRFRLVTFSLRIQ